MLAKTTTYEISYDFIIPREIHTAVTMLLNHYNYPTWRHYCHEVNIPFVLKSPRPAPLASSARTILHFDSVKLTIIHPLSISEIYFTWLTETDQLQCWVKTNLSWRSTRTKCCSCASPLKLQQGFGQTSTVNNQLLISMLINKSQPLNCIPLINFIESSISSGTETDHAE